MIEALSLSRSLLYEAIGKMICVLVKYENKYACVEEW